MEGEPSCQDCRFWDGNRRYGGEGKCMKNAPTIGRQSGGINYPAWPNTDADQWCGQHEHRGCAAELKEKVLSELGRRQNVD